MPKSRPKYHKGSHDIGTLVEFIGRDYHDRGLGIIISQNKFDENYVKVFWQISRLTEEVHKAKLKRVLDIQYVKQQP